MREAAVRAHPHEAGGILVGVWSDGVDYQTVSRLTATLRSNAEEIVLLVARRGPRDYVIDAHFADRRSVRPAPIVRTGDLT